MNIETININIEVVSRHIKLTAEMKDSILAKLENIEPYPEGDLDVRVVVSKEKYGIKFDISTKVKKLFVKTEFHNEDFAVALDESVDSFNRKLKKAYRKLSKNFSYESIRYPDAIDVINKSSNKEEDSSQIVKRKKFDIKPMTEEEAKLQMQLLGHQFYVFRSGITGNINVLYKRKDGNLGLIEG